MAQKVYIGVDNIAQQVSSMYIGVDGTARKIKKAYIGVDGVAQLCYELSSEAESRVGYAKVDSGIVGEEE